MPEYRAYIVDPDGHFKNSVPLVCPDDETAKKEAKKLVNGHDVELWQRARKVATFHIRLLMPEETDRRELERRLDKFAGYRNP